ncbi:hypothetical protein V8F20_012346 [Naviculisporaceae sp. PSN 640]
MSTKDRGRDRDGVERKASTFDFAFPLRRFTSSSPSTSEGGLSRTTALGDDITEDKRGALGLNLLFQPSQAYVDLIFIHGLGGGSRKTWSKTHLLRDFWPAEWLPKDPAFSRVRIHSYGYDSDWTKGNANCLNIHHIGKSFLMELATSPHIEGSGSPIILVGHSMGGLVIKKAYMLARQDRLFAVLANRIRALYFLGTPHRGSDSAKLLRNILHVASSAPAYVTELVRGSGSLQAINDEFRQCSDRVELWSFYETQKLSSKGFSTLIVDPESATLGYPEERQVPMNADHRSICKFETPHDQNYTIIRNALVSTITRMSRQDRPSLPERLASATNERLEDWLGVRDDVEDDLSVVQEVRVAETCQWFLGKESYRNWKHMTSEAPIFWLSGKPGTGKSVISGAVIDDFQRSDIRCAYYFFKHSDKHKSKLSTCLRSLALQMASLDASIRAKLVTIQRETPNIDMDSERSIWRSIFMSGILKDLQGPCYWVIDALDECSSICPFFESILGKLGPPFTPLRVFITGRQVPLLAKHLSALPQSRVSREEISTEDSVRDIKRLVESRSRAFIVGDEESRAALVEKVVEKSNGLFLWTRLVMDELSNSFSEEDAKHVLDELPHGMECLYHRALDSISQATRGRTLAYTILEWTCCAMRPLTVRELEGALEIQTKDKFPNLGDTITSLCGQLVTIDRADRVQIIHETARDFLTDEDLSSDFPIRKREVHTKMANVCLKYLVSDELKPPRTGRRPGAGQPSSRSNRRSAFFSYALAAFSHHLTMADPSANDLLCLVSTFLKGNILTWMENIAQQRSLSLMVRVAKDLKTYHELCIAERSPSSLDMRRLKTWTADLQRVAAKFSDALITSPSSIYSTIPPFCPAQSAIYNTSGSGKRPAIVGLPNLEWDDRLSCIDFRKNKTSSLCYGGECLAVGLIGGLIALYHPTSAQEFRTLEHGETVTQLEFKGRTDILASCGMKTIKVWDVRTGVCLQVLQAPRKCLKMWFDDHILLAASSKSEIHSWDIRETPAIPQEKRVWRDSDDEDAVFLARPPMAFSIGVAHQMLAVAYSGQPITIWDLEGDAYYGTCGKRLATGDTATHPLQALQFNPNKTIELLAASYLDGDLVILDPFNDIEIERQRLKCHTLTASPDGRFLAGGTAGGVIQILEFDTLKLVYKVRTSDLWIKQLTFSHDGMQLADLRGSQCNIWTPAVLLGGSIEDDVSINTSDTYTDTPNSQKQPKITTVLYVPDTGIVCGKENGSVSLFDSATGCFTQELYCHKASVGILQWLPRKKAILSVCVSNRIQVRSTDNLNSKSMRDDERTMELDFRLTASEGNTITSATVGEIAGKVILSTRQSDHLWEMAIATEEAQLRYDQPSTGGGRTRLWVQHPASASHVVCIHQDTADIYTWQGWGKVASIKLDISLSGLQLKSSPLNDATSTTDNLHSQVLLELEEIDGSTDTKKLISLGLPVPDNATPTGNGSLATEVVSQLSDPLLRRVAHVIGIVPASGQPPTTVSRATRPLPPARIVFLDTKSWVCSMDLTTTGLKSVHVPARPESSSSSSITYSYTRHFFVPYDWFAGSRRLLGTLMTGGGSSSASSGSNGGAGGRNVAVVFAKGGDIAIVKGGLEFSEVVKVSR